MPQCKQSVKSTSTLQTRRPRLIAPPRDANAYLYDEGRITYQVTGSNISIPLVVDTEFQSSQLHPTSKEFKPKGRQAITTQMKGIVEDEGSIYTSPHLHPEVRRHPVADSGFHPVDHLKASGYDACIRRADSAELRGLPVAEFVLYAHFAIAEIALIADGDYREDLLALYRAKGAKQPKFEMTRRLRAVTPNNRGQADWVDLPWIVTIDGHDYAVRLSVFDTVALHGQASYKDLAEASGVELKHKDNFTPQQKAQMMQQYQTQQEYFDSYALGDLYVYDMLKANASNFREVYRDLGIEEYYTVPKLTIGSTVRDLFMAVLSKELGIAPGDKQARKELEENYLKPTSAQHLRQSPTRTQSLLSKCEGGRCRNNRPTHTQFGRENIHFDDESVTMPHSVVKTANGEAIKVDLSTSKLLCDLDMSGCYGEGQRNQRYFIGRPQVMDFDATSSRNEYPTLREWLKMYEGELGEDNWFARASVEGDLEYPQDFLASWFIDGKGGDILAASKYAAARSSDTESLATDVTEFNEEDGNLKLFNHNIYNATLTHSFIDWLNNVADGRQRNELLDRLRISASVVYPNSWQVHSYEELKSAYASHNGRNTIKRVGGKRKAKVRRDENECHAWLGFNLGELLIDDLLSNRKMYEKGTPMNTLFKLCTNTLYGDMTSKFFQSANVVVGNNITARARALAWYMEKGLYGWQTITDGCVFDPNRVVYALGDRRVTAKAVVNLHRTSDLAADRRLKLAPIGGFDRIDISYDWVEWEEDGKPKKEWLPTLLMFKDGTLVETFKHKEAYAWIDAEAMRHLQRTFPNVRILHADSTSLKPKKDEQGKPIKQFIPRVGQFEFESKKFYTAGTFHGSANYLLVNPNDITLKMRSYETKKAHYSYDGREDDEDGFITYTTERYGESNNPAKDFMLSLLRDPERVPRQDPFFKSAILKPGDYRNRSSFAESGYVPGDDFYKLGLLRELSLSQHTQRTYEQWKRWESHTTKDKDRTGQSLERFFLNEDDTLNYQLMTNTLDTLAADKDTKDPYDKLDPNEHTRRTKHPKFDLHQRMKEILLTGGAPIFDEDD